MNDSCNCEFSEDYIFVNKPYCPTEYPNWIVLWGRVFGRKPLSSKNILEYLQTWLEDDESTVVIEGVTLSTLKHCSFHLEENELPFCEPVSTPKVPFSTPKASADLNTSSTSHVTIIVTVVMLVMLILVLAVIVCIVIVVLQKKAYIRKKR